MTTLRVDRQDVHGIQVMKITGTVDSRNDDLLTSAFEALEKAGCTRAIVDLSAAQHVSSAGWAWLLDRHRLWKRAGREFAIAGMGDAVRSTFEFLELGFSLPSARSVLEAVTLLRATPAQVPARPTGPTLRTAAA